MVVVDTSVGETPFPVELSVHSTLSPLTAEEDFGGAVFCSPSFWWERCHSDTGRVYSSGVVGQLEHTELDTSASLEGLSANTGTSSKVCELDCVDSKYPDSLVGSSDLGALEAALEVAESSFRWPACSREGLYAGLFTSIEVSASTRAFPKGKAKQTRVGLPGRLS